MKLTYVWLTAVLYFITFLGRAEQTKITVGIEDLSYYPHYDFSNGQKAGYVLDFIKLFEKYSDYKFTFLPMPIKRLKYQFFNKQTIDLLYPFNPKWADSSEAELHLVYSPPIVGILGGTMVLKSQLGAGLNRFRYLAVPRGFTPIEWYKIRGRTKVSFIEVANSLDALQMVIKRRADGADIEYNVAQHLMSKHNLGGNLELDPDLPFSAVNFHFVTLKHVNLIKDMTNFVNAYSEDIAKLKRQYDLKETLSDIAEPSNIRGGTSLALDPP